MSERIYRVLLYLYPREFRGEYGAAMAEHFRRQLAKARARRRLAATPRFWIFIFFDALTTAMLERLTPRRASGAPKIGYHRENEAGLMDSFMRDLSYSLRRLLAAPVFSILTIAILAFGIGANTAIFSVVNAFLLRPQPFANPERLVDIYQDSDDGRPASTSFPAYRDIATHSGLFSGVAASYTNVVRLKTHDANAVRSLVEYASSSYLPVLGVAPTMGRWFRTSEDKPGEGAAAVVSHRTWRSKFGSDPDILGKTVRLNGGLVQIVGIGPAGFNGLAPGVAVDFWLSLATLATTGRRGAINTLDRREDHWFMVKARLAPGVQAEDAQRGMTRLAESLAHDFPKLNEGRGMTVFPSGQVRLHPMVDGFLFPTAASLMTVVALVLLVACSNLATLLLVRGSARGKEIAIRLAMGATRKRLVGQLLMESIVLALAGGIAGVFLARSFLAFVLALRLPLPVPMAVDLSLDYRVVGFALALSLLTAIAFGLAPALRACRADPVVRLRDETSASLFRGRRFNFRNLMVIVQVSTSVVLLVLAGLFVTSLSKAQRVDVGFAVEDIAVLMTDPTQVGYGSEESKAFVRRFVQRLDSRPDVVAVALSNPLPLTQARGSSTLVLEGYAPAVGTNAVEVERQTVGVNYFETLGIPLRHGRVFVGADRDGARPVALINEAMATTYWGTADAVGRRFRSQGAVDSWIEVVGVVANSTVRELDELPTPLFYRPWEQNGSGRTFVVTRARTSPEAMVATLRDELRQEDSALPVLELKTMKEHLGAALFFPRMGASALGAFAALALFLTGLGVYTIVAFSLAQRTLELGIRMALGGQTSVLVRMVINEVVGTIFVGLALGLVVALVATRPLGSLLHGVAPTDPLTYILVTAVLVLAALAATYLPARRIASMDPVTALRVR